MPEILKTWKQEADEAEARANHPWVVAILDGSNGELDFCILSPSYYWAACAVVTGIAKP